MSVRITRMKPTDRISRTFPGVDDEARLNIGRSTLKKVRDLWNLLGYVPDGLANKVIRQWYPGGGANAHSLKVVSSGYYGVDISGNNLAEACRVLSVESELYYFHPVLLADMLAVIAGSIPKENKNDLGKEIRINTFAARDISSDTSGFCLIPV